MVVRAREHLANNPRPVFSAQRVQGNEVSRKGEPGPAAFAFTFADRPVEITEELGSFDAGAGECTVVVRYGDDKLRIPATLTPEHVELPILRRHQAWLAVVRFVEAVGIPTELIDERIASGELRDRLAIVTRSLPPGSDERTWGEIDRKHWNFTFYELLPEGGFERSTGRMPPNRRAADPSAGELVRNSWQHVVAFQVVPNQNFVPSVGGRPPPEASSVVGAIGWTLPAAFLTGLGGVVALAFSSRARGGRSDTSRTVPTP